MSKLGPYPDMAGLDTYITQSEKIVKEKTDFKKLKETKDVSHNNGPNIKDVKKRFSHNYSSNYYDSVMDAITALKFKKVVIDMKIIKTSNKTLTNEKYCDLLKKSFIIEKFLISIATRISEDESFYEKTGICDYLTLKFTTNITLFV